MKKAKKIDIIVKIPFDLPSQEVLRMGQRVLTELLKDRDWDGIVENEMTFTRNDYDYTQENLNIVEFKMTLTSDMTKDDLIKMAFRFIYWLKDVED